MTRAAPAHNEQAGQIPATGLYCPVWPRKQLDRWQRLGKIRFTELGRELRCSRCREWLPADSEFFFAQNNTRFGLINPCRACVIEKRQRQLSRQRLSQQGFQPVDFTYFCSTGTP